MEVRIECPHCGLTFAAPTSMVGGHANCPECGKASPVAGLRDPLWRLWQVGGVLVAGLASWAGYAVGGIGVALATLVVALLVTWLVSRAL